MKVSILLVLVIIVLAPILGYIIGRGIAPETVREVERVEFTDDLPEYMIGYLADRLNADEPLDLIKQDLISKPELIPYDAELGGTMGFYDASSLRVLSDRWVIASFEDGHIGGYVLLKYEIDPEGNITWEVVDSYLM